MNKRISFAAVFTAILLIGAIFLSMLMGEKDLSPTSSSLATNDEIPQEEMRGLWVSYISLDMSGTDRSFDSYKAKFGEIINAAKDMECNTLIVHVRPFSDALYESEVYPSSHVLSGTQGVSSGYDALEYMCKTAHDNGLFIHAWINPYRVSTAGTPAKLAKTNPYMQDSSIGIELESGIYLNPAKKAARQIVIDGVKEIVENYDVDGIHFDDYFYPPDCGNFDAEEYNTYRKSVGNITKALTLEKWRQSNVNLLLADVYKAIKEIDSSVVFGISPQGNIENNYAIGADVKTWCEAIGYADYICPQMYYSTDHPVVRFEDSLKQWKEFKHHQGLKVYIGLGAYKAGTDADSGTWLGRQDELATQLELLRDYGYDGYMLYDYSALTSDTAQDELAVFRSVI